VNKVATVNPKTERNVENALLSKLSLSEILHCECIDIPRAEI